MKHRIGFISSIFGLCALISAFILISSRSGQGQNPGGPKTTPFQIALTFTQNGQQQTFQVPKDRILVIQGVGSQYANFDVTLQTVASGSEATWGAIGAAYNAPPCFVALQVYADSGSTVTVTNMQNTGGTTVNLTGYLTNHL